MDAPDSDGPFSDAHCRERCMRPVSGLSTTCLKQGSCDSSWWITLAQVQQHFPMLPIVWDS